jgi:uncharacterized membrane protein
MTLVWEWNATALIAIAVQTTIFIIVLVRTHDRAKSASDRVEKVEREANLGFAAVNAALSQLRQHIAEKYADKEALREMEGRITSAIAQLGVRLDRFLERKDQ